MKKLELKLAGVHPMLSKEQMKLVIGGEEQGGDPGEPSGGDDGGDDGGGGYKCCWSGTTNCSACVARATSSWTCVSGADLTPC